MMKDKKSRKNRSVLYRHSHFALYRSNCKTFYIIITPFLFMFVVYKLFPMLWGLYMSFTNYSGFNIHNLKFVGWDNYKRVFTDSQAFSSLGRTFLIGVIVVPLTMVVCNTMAILLSMKFKHVALIRTLFYVPSLLPAVAVGSMWNGMFQRDGGIINEVVKLFGKEPVNWLGYDYVFTSLIIMMLWGAGAGVLNNIASIKNIPRDLFEAAELDGAGNLAMIFHIILPLSSNMNYMALVTGVINSLQLFSQPVMLSGSGMTAVPLQPIYTYMVHTYQQIFVNLRFGYGLALTWVVFIIMTVFTRINEFLSKKWVHTGE